MHKKKEIIIIILILLFTILLAFIPTIITNMNTNVEDLKKEESRANTIEIIIDGEIKEDEIKLIVPYGASYGYIISKINNYLNPYSVIDKDLTKRYYIDSKITIESSDIKTIDIIVDKDKININTATKEELMALYGIGDKRSDTIINYRKEHTIESFEELKTLIGVSNEVIEAIKEKAVL